RLLPGGAALAHPDHDVEARVLEVERMRAALAAVAEDGDAGALEGLLVDVFVRIQLHRPHSSGAFRDPKHEKPRSGFGPVRGLGSCFPRAWFVSGVREGPAPRSAKEQ